jgi:hypothetical protein
MTLKPFLPVADPSPGYLCLHIEGHLKDDEIVLLHISDEEKVSVLFDESSDFFVMCSVAVLQHRHCNVCWEWNVPRDTDHEETVSMMRGRHGVGLRGSAFVHDSDMLRMRCEPRQVIHLIAEADRPRWLRLGLLRATRLENTLTLGNYLYREPPRSLMLTHRRDASFYSGTDLLYVSFIHWEGFVPSIIRTHIEVLIRHYFVFSDLDAPAQPEFFVSEAALTNAADDDMQYPAQLHLQYVLTTSIVAAHPDMTVDILHWAEAIDITDNGDVLSVTPPRFHSSTPLMAFSIENFILGTYLGIKAFDPSRPG